MKKLFTLFLNAGLTWSICLTAQTDAKFMSQDQSQTDAKALYVNNQGYLSASSLKDYKTFYGDSLKGFDEEKVKANLLSRYPMTSEFINVMNYTKRNFINKKYKIGPESPEQQAKLQLQLQKQTMPPQPPSKGKSLGGGNNVVNLAP